MTVILHNIAHRLKNNILEISGFTTASVTVPIWLRELLTSVGTTIVLAAVSGFIGAIVAHFTKKLIERMKW